jgi:hypothetical protein
MYHH